MTARGSEAQPRGDSGSFLRRVLQARVICPLLALLRIGSTPEKMAWSIAAGVMIGINPLLGSTTVFCLAIAFAFRLNIAASQLFCHLLYPLEIALAIPFIRLGSRIFHTAPMPLSALGLVRSARVHPLETARSLWVWEGHALVLWAAVAIVATPLLARALTPLLQELLLTLEP